MSTKYEIEFKNRVWVKKRNLRTWGRHGVDMRGGKGRRKTQILKENKTM